MDAAWICWARERVCARLGGLAAIAVGLMVICPTQAEDRKPNLIVLLADDAGWGDYSICGNRSVHTPHIDSLAREGVRLDRFYVTPLCAPTRAEFLTGRYYLRTGVSGVTEGRERLNLDEQTIADFFRQAGYATGIFGKWHNGTQWPYHPTARGFQEFFGYTAGHWGQYFDPPLEDSRGRFVATKGYIADICTDHALQFIRKHRDRPFFCYLAFPTPHSPWAVPEKYWQRFRDRPILQRATRPDLENLDHTRCALAMMENQDDNVGRVLNLLRELNLDRQTIVVYFSDNGPNTWRYNGGMKGRKGQTDEGGVRSVCFLRWPARLPAGHVVRRIAGAIDLLPTLAALAGIRLQPKKPLDGWDLSPLLLGQDVQWPERMIFSCWGKQVSVRTDRYRLDAQGRLFDMQTDPGQTRDLAQQLPEVAERLKKAAQQWYREVTAERGDPNQLEGAKWLRRVDPRPIPVGFREFPITILPARDGEPRGGVRRSASAPNSSYFVHWTSTEDSMVWWIEVHTSGLYEVSMDYTCPQADAGAIIELSFQHRRLRAKVEPAWDPPLYTNQDTLPRPPAESPMKEFRTLRLGTMHLEQGQGLLVLRAVHVPGRSVADVRRITLTLLPEKKPTSIQKTEHQKKQYPDPPSNAVSTSPYNWKPNLNLSWRLFSVGAP